MISRQLLALGCVFAFCLSVIFAADATTEEATTKGMEMTTASMGNGTTKGGDVSGQEHVVASALCVAGAALLSAVTARFL